jgi:Protein of unknown function (DUF3822)
VVEYFPKFIYYCVNTMSKTETNTQVYNAAGSEPNIVDIGHVICVIHRRGVMAGAFSHDGKVISIHFKDYKRTFHVWMLDFFEHYFSNEPLLANKSVVRGIFVTSDKNMIVPDALYEERTSEQWFRKIHFIETDDAIKTYPVKEENARYMMAFPLSIHKLVDIHFENAGVYPLGLYQLTETVKYQNHLLCCVGTEEVAATLFVNKQLYWHQVFSYEKPDEIAYQLLAVCQEKGISPAAVNVQCTTTNGNSSASIAALNQYFPGMENRKAKDNHAWLPVINLLQGLYHITNYRQ